MPLQKVVRGIVKIGVSRKQTSGSFPIGFRTLVTVGLTVALLDFISLLLIFILLNTILFVTIIKF